MIENCNCALTFELDRLCNCTIDLLPTVCGNRLRGNTLALPVANRKNVSGVYPVGVDTPSWSAEIFTPLLAFTL